MNSIKALYVYSDIADHQYLGDAYSPLLRVVGVENNKKYGEYIERIYTAPHYVTVAKNKISSIEIDIRSDTGEGIAFGIGKVIVKLHFRPKPFY